MEGVVGGGMGWDGMGWDGMGWVLSSRAVICGTVGKTV